MRIFEFCRAGSWVALSVVFSGLWMGNPAEGAPVTVPTSLNAGDQYRWVFVTSSTHQATSSDISTYNTIVDALGDNAIESDWKVIGSTADDDAIVNTDTPIATSGVSIWRLDGVKVADDYADFWDGSLQANIDRTEEPLKLHLQEPLTVWTGTGYFGVKVTSVWALGAGSPFGVVGHYDPAHFGGWTYVTEASKLDEGRLYGMSEVFTVEAAAVPEPSSAILLGMGVICVGWSRFRRKRRQASSTV